MSAPITAEEIEEIRAWMDAGPRPSFGRDDVLSDASVAYLCIDKLLRALDK